jgi:hypothetical protein
MRPRKTPQWSGITQSALDAAAQYGRMGRYRQYVDRAQTIVVRYLEDGLPESDFLAVVRGKLPTTMSMNFWIYVEISHGMYLGFAESADALWLRLVAFRPMDLISLDDMLALTGQST